jgi:hypothetical protein
VAKLGGTLGRTGLAQFLTGSKAGWLETFTQHSCYGQLADLSQQAVIDIIDALITDGQLATTGGNRPKVILPGLAGVKAQVGSRVSEDSILSTQVQATSVVNPEAHSRLPEISPSTRMELAPDSRLLETLQAWRTQQAKNQGVPPYIIFPNKVLEAIAGQRPTTLTALNAIVGVGPAKLEQYGETILRLVGESSDDDKLQDQVQAFLKPAEVNLHHTSEPLTAIEASEEPQAEDIQIDPSISDPPTSAKGKQNSLLSAVLTVVSDLEGLLNPESLATLLTAAPGEIVSFSDHELCGAFYDRLSSEAVESYLQEAIRAGQLELSLYRRLVLPGLTRSK